MYGLTKIDHLRQMVALSLIAKNAHKSIIYPGNPTTFRSVNGSNSSFSSFTALGGGRGGDRYGDPGGSGGSGGGAMIPPGNVLGGASGTPGFAIGVAFAFDSSLTTFNASNLDDKSFLNLISLDLASIVDE